MPKRSHLLLLTLAVDAILLIGTVQAQAEEREVDPPLLVRISTESPVLPISATLTSPLFPTLIPDDTPAQ